MPRAKGQKNKVPRRKSHRDDTVPGNHNTKPWLSEALRKKWQDPEFRARMTIRKCNRGNRRGIPDGMRKRLAMALWDEARIKAKEMVDRLDKEGLLRNPNVDEETMAKAALVEAFTVALSPMADSTKMAAIRTVLEWTKAKPATKTDLKLSTAEAWLERVITDAKSESEGA